MAVGRQDGIAVRPGVRVIVYAETRARLRAEVFESRIEDVVHAHFRTKRRRAERVVENTYRTLMTRGLKDCFVYCVDPETNVYFRSFVEGIGQRALASTAARPNHPPRGSR